MPLPQDKKDLNCEHCYHIAFSYVLNLGPINFSRLVNYFGTAEQAWESDKGDLLKAGLSERLASAVVETRSSISLSEILDKLDAIDAYVLTPDSHGYPAALKEIYDPPYCLYVRGKMTVDDQLALAVVGSRKMTSYGRSSAEAFVSELVKHGLTIVSGLALGTDAVAHKAALKAGGRTIAVLASGVDTITPYSNVEIARSILKNDKGAIISECPLGTKPRKQSFPVRNRIISGLSLGTLVVEAGKKSGTMHTAKSCLEQGRDVFAVPGSIFNSQSEGTHYLIKSGAKLVHSVGDILDEISLEQTEIQLESAGIFPGSEEETAIVDILREEPLGLDALANITNTEVSVILSVLTKLEMKGLIKSIQGQKYAVVD